MLRCCDHFVDVAPVVDCKKVNRYAANDSSPAVVFSDRFVLHVVLALGAGDELGPVPSLLDHSSSVDTFFGHVHERVDNAEGRVELHKVAFALQVVCRGLGRPPVLPLAR